MGNEAIIHEVENNLVNVITTWIEKTLENAQ